MTASASRRSTDRQDQRQGPQARLYGRARRNSRQRIHRGDAARRGRIPLHHGFLGRALQDRRPAGRRRPCRLAHGSRPGKTGPNRGAALWGNLVITAAGGPPRIIATNKDTGKVVWETNVSTDTPEVNMTSAPLPIRDKIIVGAAGGDNGVRDWMAGLDAATGKAAVAQLHDSGARRARQRNLEGQEQRLADRRRRHLGDRDLRSRHPPDHLGHRQSCADV